MKTKLFQLKVWAPDSSRMTHRFFVKSDLLFGSDKASDIKLEGLSGLHARLDLNSNELHWIEDNRIQKLEEGELFQIGTHVFQWKTLNWADKRFLTPVISILAGLILLSGGALFVNRESLECSDLALILASGRWNSKQKEFTIEIRTTLDELELSKQSFLSALRDQNFIRAKGELVDMRRVITHQHHDPRCGALSGVDQMELSFSQALTEFYLKREQPHLAVREVTRIREQLHLEVPKKVHRQMKRVAKKLYLEGYRLEELDPLKGGDLMDQAADICNALGLNSKCQKTEWTEAKDSQEGVSDPK